MRTTVHFVKRQIKAALRYYGAPHIRRGDLEYHLCQLGVRRGGVLLVHSSLSSPGYFVGGAEMILSTILDFLGDAGTLVIPSHRWASVNRGNRTFDVRTSPSEVGRLSETFRHWPGCQRSLHPSHSVCALGPASEELTRDHLFASSPCGNGTPYEKLMKMGGQILLLGVSLRRNTCFHTVEAMANVPYLLKPTPDRFHITDRFGVECEVLVRCHAKAVRSRFDELEQPLRSAKCLQSSPLGIAWSHLIEGDGFCNALLPVLQQFPDLLLQSCSVSITERLLEAARSMRQD